MWLFQGVLNAGLQILLSIFAGWFCARLHLLEPEVLSRSLNTFAMKAAFPAFILHLLGIKTDLSDIEAFRALGVFILWVLLIHVACFVWFKATRGSVQSLGMNCLLLTTNNTGCIGWPVLIATVGRQGAALSMLLGILFFIQLLPVPISCFEFSKWLEAHSDEVSLPEVVSHLPGLVSAPATTTSSQQPPNQQAAPNRLQQDFRYCYGSNADYHAKPGTSTCAAASPETTANCDYLEVCVPSVTQEREQDISGNQRPATDACSIMANSKQNRASSKPAQLSQAESWLRRQQLSKAQQPLQPQLKRAKDSCDSLDCAVMPCAAGDVGLVHTVLQSTKPPASSLATLTRRLSRGLGPKVGPGSGADSGAAVAASAPAAAVQASRTGIAGCFARLPGSFGGSVPPAAATAGAPGAVGNSSSSSDAGSDSSGEAVLCKTDTAAVHCHMASTAAGLMASPFAAVDSAVELHILGGSCRDSSTDTTHDGSSALQSRDKSPPPSPPPSTAVQAPCFAVPPAAAASSGSCSSSVLGSRPGSRVDSRTCLLGPAAPADQGQSVTGSKGGAGRPSVLSVPSAAAAPGGPEDQASGQKKEAWMHAFVRTHPLLCHITPVQLQSLHLWLNLLAIVVSVSGLRRYLDPESVAALPALGWLDGVLAWFSAACIPTLLFSNGVWMMGKNILGGRRGQAQVMLVLLLKLTLLPAVMVGLTKLFRLSGPYSLSLVLLSSCPLAPLAFLVCQQYGLGTELATSVTIQGVLLMLPQMMAVIKISQVTGLYNVELLVR